MHKLSLVPYMLLVPGAAAAGINPGGLFIASFDHILGTSLSLKLAAPSQAIAREAEGLILKEIARLENVLSSFLPASELGQWLAAPLHQAVPVSEDLFAVLAGFDHWQEQTRGMLNAGTAHLGQLWASAAQKQQPPAPADRQAAVNAVNQRHWQLDAAGQTATRLTAVPLQLHSFTKGYVLDKAAGLALQVPGLSGLVLNSGGDLVVRGNWQENVHVANPRAHAENAEPLARLAVQNLAVATSGDYRRGLQVGTEWISHILDPRTGMPARDIISATVLHPDAVTAGALATAFNVASPAERTSLAAEHPGTEYFLVSQDGQTTASKGWPAAAPIPAAASNGPTVAHLLTAPAKAKDWNTKQELLITLELARISGRYHRPFVAVWIEDQAGKPIRQLALWYNKPKWLRDLRAWNKLQTQDAVSVTSATRSPGQYTLVWDGKDDAGKLVKQGKYTVMIEVAREHGTYQLIRETMDFNGKLKQQTLKGNVEITAAALDYRQKPKSK